MARREVAVRRAMMATRAGLSSSPPATTMPPRPVFAGYRHAWSNARQAMRLGPDESSIEAARGRNLRAILGRTLLASPRGSRTIVKAPFVHREVVVCHSAGRELRFEGAPAGCAFDGRDAMDGVHHLGIRLAHEARLLIHDHFRDRPTSPRDDRRPARES